MSALHLYELSEQWQQLNALAESEDLPPDVIRDTLEGLQGEWKDKAINVAKFILNLESSAAAKKLAMQKMAASADRLAKRAESLRQYLLLNFQGLNQTKVESEWFDIIVKNNPPAVGVDDVNKVPDEFLKEPDAPPIVSDDQTLTFSFDDSGPNGCPSTWTIKDSEGVKVKSGTIAFEPASVDKAKVKKAHKAGIEVAGCHPEQGQRVEIVL